MFGESKFSTGNVLEAVTYFKLIKFIKQPYGAKPYFLRNLVTP